MSSLVSPSNNTVGIPSSSHLIPSSSGPSVSVYSAVEDVNTDDGVKGYKTPPEYYECIPNPTSPAVYGPIFPPLTFTYQLSFRPEAAYRSFMFPVSEMRDHSATVTTNGGTSSQREKRVVVGADNVYAILSSYVIPSIKDVVLDGLANLYGIEEYGVPNANKKYDHLCDEITKDPYLHRMLRGTFSERRTSNSRGSNLSVVGIYPFVNEKEVKDFSDATFKDVTVNGGRIVTGAKCESFGNDLDDRYPCIVIQESILLSVAKNADVGNIEFNALQSIHNGLDNSGNNGDSWLSSALLSPSFYGMVVAKSVIKRVKFVNGAGGTVVYPPLLLPFTEIEKEDGHRLHGPEIGLVVFAVLTFIGISIFVAYHHNTKTNSFMRETTRRLQSNSVVYGLKRSIEIRFGNNREKLQKPQPNIDVFHWREALQDAKLKYMSQDNMVESDDDFTKSTSLEEEQSAPDTNKIIENENVELESYKTFETEESNAPSSRNEGNDANRTTQSWEVDNGKEEATPELLEITKRLENTVKEEIDQCVDIKKVFKQEKAIPPLFVAMSNASKVTAASSSKMSTVTSRSGICSLLDTKSGNQSMSIGTRDTYLDPAIFVKADPLNISRTHSALDVHKCSSATCRLCFQNSQIKFVSADFEADDDYDDFGQA